MKKNMENDKKLGLIARLKAKYSTPVVKKRIAALAMAATMMLTPALTGCVNTNNNNNGNNPGTQQGSGENKYSQYSKILQDVLTSDYYNGLLEQVKTNTSLFSSAKFDPHPYGFLEDEGHNVSAIKNGTLDCNTYAYVLNEEPNNLYLMTYVETNASTPYYTCYLIKYTLTNKEMQDYDMLHKDEYIQAVFINDAISNAKTPTIVSEVRCTVEAHNGLKAYLNSNTTSSNLLHKNSLYDIMLKDFDKTTNKFNVYLISGTNSKMKSDKHISLFPLKKGTARISTTSDNAFAGPYEYGPMDHNSSEISLDKTKSITMYNTQNFMLNNIYGNNLAKAD